MFHNPIGAFRRKAEYKNEKDKKEIREKYEREAEEKDAELKDINARNVLLTVENEKLQKENDILRKENEKQNEGQPFREKEEHNNSYEKSSENTTRAIFEERRFQNRLWYQVILDKMTSRDAEQASAENSNLTEKNSSIASKEEYVDMAAPESEKYEGSLDGRSVPEGGSWDWKQDVMPKDRGSRDDEEGR